MFFFSFLIQKMHIFAVEANIYRKYIKRIFQQCQVNKKKWKWNHLFTFSYIRVTKTSFIKFNFKVQKYYININLKPYILIKKKNHVYLAMHKKFAFKYISGIFHNQLNKKISSNSLDLKNLFVQKRRKTWKKNKFTFTERRTNNFVISE